MSEHHPINPAYLSREISVQHSYEDHMARRQAREQKLGLKICDLCIKTQHANGRIYIPETSEPLSALLEGEIGMFENDFPYQFAAGGKVKTHHMLLPLAHVRLAKDLSPKAREAWHNTLDELEASARYSYSFAQMPSDSRSSVPGHLHKHFLEFEPNISLESIVYQRGVTADVRFSSQV